VLRGLHLLYIEGGRSFDEAGHYFRTAISLDPQYAQAHSHLAWWLTMCIGEGRTRNAAEDRRLAVQHACRAIELDPRDAWALAIAGHTFSFLQQQFSVALDMFQQALAVNPNCAIAWARSATTLAYMGRGEEAKQRVRNALQISPFDQLAFSFCTTHGIASMVCGQSDEAVWWLEKARRLFPRYRAAERLLIAAHSLCGNIGQARAMAAEFLQAEPDFRVGVFGSWYPMQSPHRERMLGALQQAGLPP
jgi:adenylate cyclase